MIRRYLNAIFLRRRNRIWPLIVLALLFTGWLLLVQQSELHNTKTSDGKQIQRVGGDASGDDPVGSSGEKNADIHKVVPDVSEEQQLPVSSKSDAKSNNALPVPFAVEKPSDGVCSQTYQTEAKTDHQTFEMWKDFSKTGGYAGDYWGTLQPKNLPAGEKYKIIIMPMTHVDPGWLETFDEYTKDTNNILTYMLRFLTAHKEMRFTWCETVFFERWWQNVTEEDKKAVKGMVDSGQLELTSGSWVMTDEANPYFPITVDNIVEGHQFLKKELDITPKVMWSNDPFGYGPSVPYLFRKAGIKKAIINRIHRGIKMELQKMKAVPFNWRQVWAAIEYLDATGDSDVETHVLPFAHYDVLSSCGPNPGVCCEFDFKRITHFSCPGPKPVPITNANVESKGARFFDQFKRVSSMYDSPVVLMVLGDDFRFNSESEWSQHFDNFIPLFKHMNEKYAANLEIGFGTYSDYFRELDKWYADKKIKPKTLSGDFFPYNDWGGDYWTGYFTTRPFFKRRGRKLHAHIRAADIMSASAFKSKSITEQQKVEMIDKLTMARRNLSLFQHHDAITGTSRVNVMENYGQLLWSALSLATEVLEQSSSILLGVSKESDLALNEFPPVHNISEVKQPLVFDGASSISVAVYNALPNERIEVISLHVTSPKIKVADGDVDVHAQIEPILEPSEGTADKELFQLVFLAKIPALGFKVFQLKEEEKQPTHTSVVDILVNAETAKKENIFPKIFKIKFADEGQLKIKTSRVETFHDQSGYVKGVTIEGIGNKKFECSFHQYDQTRSGAYIFAPHGEANPFPAANSLYFVTKGPLQQTAHIHVARLYHSVTVREVPGPEGEQLHIYNTIDLRSLQNHELVTRLTTDLTLKERQFFTDSIGLQMFRREAYSNLKVEANYYPMPTAAFLQDDKTRVTVLGDVSHGVTSPKAGQLEIMLDRILSQDDSKGLGYGPNSLPKDNVPVTVGFTVVFEAVKNDRLPAHFAHHSSTAHQALQALLYPPMVLTTSSAVSAPSTAPIASFPCDIQLLTNRPLPTGVDERLIVLSRPGVDCQVGTTPQLCNGKTDINQSMRTYLKWLGVTTVTETNLGGVEVLKADQAVDSVDFQTTPMDLRAFKVRL